MDSILVTIKAMIGPSASYDIFDIDLITHINSIFFILYQLGVCKEPFTIKDESAVWDDFHTDEDLEAVKTYIYLKVRMYFDPPTNSALISAINEQIKELEWRLNVQVD